MDLDGEVRASNPWWRRSARRPSRSLHRGSAGAALSAFVAPFVRAGAGARFSALRRPSPLSARILPALFAAVAAGACGSERSPDASSARVTVDTVADTVIVTNRPPADGPPSLALVEELAIGSLDGEVTFGEILHLAPDGGGGVYVFDRQGPLLRRFGPDGAVADTLGRAGEGPGEYGRLGLGLVVDERGRVWQHDWGNLRVNRWGPGGEFEGTIPVGTGYVTTVPGAPGFFLGPPGEVLVAERSPDIARGLMLLVVGEGGVSDTLQVPGLPGVPAERGGAYRVEASWDWRPDEGFLVGVNAEDRFEWRRPDGRVLRVVREGAAPVPVSAEERGAWVRRYEWFEAQPNARAPEGEWVPDVMPPWQTLQAGTDGRAWVRRYVPSVRVEVEEAGDDGPPPVPFEQPRVYEVFGPDGTLEGVVRFPEGATPLHFGDGIVWAVRTGELDEPYAVRYRVGSGAG